MTSAQASSPTYVNAATRIPSRASVIPELETMPPVVSSSGSLSINRPPPIGAVNGTGRTSTSTTQEPTTTQSNVFSIDCAATLNSLKISIHRFEQEVTEKTEKHNS